MKMVFAILNGLAMGTAAALWLSARAVVPVVSARATVITAVEQPAGAGEGDSQ